MLKILNHRDLPRKTHLKLKIHECRVGLTLDLRERRFYLALSRIDMIWMRRWKFYVMIPPKNEKYNLLGTWAEIEGFQFPVGRSQNGTGLSLELTHTWVGLNQSLGFLFLLTQIGSQRTLWVYHLKSKINLTILTPSFLFKVRIYIWYIYFVICIFCRFNCVIRCPSSDFLAGTCPALYSSQVSMSVWGIHTSTACHVQAMNKLPSLKLIWPMKIPIFPGKYHQNGGFSMAMLISGTVFLVTIPDNTTIPVANQPVPVSLYPKLLGDGSTWP